MERIPAVNEQLINRAIGASKLDPMVYEEIKADESATSQAFLIVILSALSAALGAALGMFITITGGSFGSFDSDFAISGAIAMVVFIVVLFIAFFISILAWFVYSFLAFWVGTNLFEGRDQATFPQVLRVIGFAQSPRILSVVSFIPILGSLVSLGILVWVAVATVIALRQIMRLTTQNAIITVVVAAIGYFIVSAVLTGILIASIVFAIIAGAVIAA